MTRKILTQIALPACLVAATAACSLVENGKHDPTSPFADPAPQASGTPPAQTPGSTPQTPGPTPRIPDPVPRVYNPATKVYEPAPLVYNPATNAYEPASQAGSPAPRRDEDVHYGPERGDWELLLGGTGSNDKDFDNGSIGFSGSIGYFLTDNLELSLRQNLNWADFGDSTYIATTRGAIDFHFEIGHVYPFIGANLGYLYGDDIDDTWEAAPEVGVKWFVKDDTFIYAMGEYQFFLENTKHSDSGFDHGNFVYSLGIGFTF